MRQSKLFSKTLRNTPSDIEDKATALLTRAGFINKFAAGITSYLPLGQRVVNNIISIICEEMDAIGAQRILMPTLQPKQLLEKTGRWETMGDEMYRLKDRRDTDLSLGMTHEEVVTDLARQVINSYQDLPLAVYQIQTKFRDEPRAKAGLMRGREFLMKDMYSFDKDEKSFSEFYEKAASAYLKIFERIGLPQVYQVAADGGVFTSLSNHEFQLPTEIGEDTLYLKDKDARVAINAEQIEQYTKEGFTATKSLELGHIFSLGSKYSSALGANFVDETGKQLPLIMGCYGTGISRLVAASAAIFSDQKGLIWPETIAPYQYHLIDLTTDKSGEKIYSKLITLKKDVLFDDRAVSAGEKFTDADLIGIPNRLVVSAKTKGKIELKPRNSQEIKLVDIDQLD